MKNLSYRPAFSPRKRTPGRDPLHAPSPSGESPGKPRIQRISSPLRPVRKPVCCLNFLKKYPGQTVFRPPDLAVLIHLPYYFFHILFPVPGLEDVPITKVYFFVLNPPRSFGRVFDVASRNRIGRGVYGQRAANGCRSRPPRLACMPAAIARAPLSRGSTNHRGSPTNSTTKDSPGSPHRLLVILQCPAARPWASAKGISFSFISQTTRGPSRVPKGMPIQRVPEGRRPFRRGRVPGKATPGGVPRSGSAGRKTPSQRNVSGSRSSRTRLQSRPFFLRTSISNDQEY